MADCLLDARLVAMMVCPVCHHPVAAGPTNEDHRWLHCGFCGRYYPVQDGIPVMLKHQATYEPPAS